MRRSKQEIYEMIFSNVKEVMLDVCKGYEYDVSKCLTFKELLRVAVRYDDLYGCMENTLYNVKSFKDMEKIISVMNVLFDCAAFDELKKNLFNQLVKHMSIERYLVVRHLVYVNTDELIDVLYNEGYADALMCAKFSLIEEDYIGALYYLRELDKCEDDAVLDMIASYSFSDYLSLERYYSKKAKGYVLAYS